MEYQTKCFHIKRIVISYKNASQGIKIVKEILIKIWYNNGNI